MSPARLKLKLSDVARLVKGEVIGNQNRIITGVSSLEDARGGDITFLLEYLNQEQALQTRASAIILKDKVPGLSIPIVKVEQPFNAVIKLIHYFLSSKSPLFRGIDRRAVISKGARISKDVTIGPYAFIGPHTRIGKGSVIYPGCYIGQDCTLGSHVVLYPQVVIVEKVKIGDRVTVHPGTVIGSDGFRYVSEDGKRKKVPHIGEVEIGSDVEIGSGVTIDRATVGKTAIGSGTKIDNLVHIAHNVKIGKDCLIVAQVGISGSTVIEDEVTLAGQAGLVGHIRIGRGAVVAAQAGVTKSVPEKTVVSGYPAQPHEKAKKLNALVQRLPELYQKVKDLEEKTNRGV